MKNIPLLLFSIFIFCTSCAEASPKPLSTVNLNKTRYVLFSEVAKCYGMSVAVTAERFSMASTWSRFTCYPEKLEASLNGVKLYLSLAPMLVNGRAFISEIDYKQFIDPFFKVNFYPAKPVRTIVLDPGHGGKDPGTRSRYVLEKNLALEIAKKLSAILKKDGYNVILTRTNDTFPTLDSRAYLANKVKADLFISIHANAAAPSIQGIECFILAATGTASTSSSSIVNSPSPGSNYVAASARAGFEIHQSLIRQTKAVDRGLRHARFVVLKNTPCPSVLVEVGFLSNNRESYLLGTTEYKNKIILGLYQGINKYAKALKN